MFLAWRRIAISAGGKIGRTRTRRASVLVTESLIFTIIVARPAGAQTGIPVVPWQPVSVVAGVSAGDEITGTNCSAVSANDCMICDGVECKAVTGDDVGLRYTW